MINVCDVNKGSETIGFNASPESIITTSKEKCDDAKLFEEHSFITDGSEIPRFLSLMRKDRHKDVQSDTRLPYF